MKPVIQTITGDRGNCYAACLASILEIPLETIPDFHENATEENVDEIWWNNVRTWLKNEYDLGVICLSFTDASQWHSLWIDGYHIVSGTSPRGMCHATVWFDGKMVHDPHPDQSGLVDVQFIDMLYPLFDNRFRFPVQPLP